MEKNSIIKEALLDIKNIESAINSNTKEMLRGVAREEIDSVVKESLMKEIYEEEDLEAAMAAAIAESKPEAKAPQVVDVPLEEVPAEEGEQKSAEELLSEFEKMLG